VTTLTRSASPGAATLTPSGLASFTHANDAPVTEARHSAARRFAERFALIAFALYHLPLFLNNYPTLGGGGMSDHGLAISWGHVYAPVGVWVARHALHVTGPMPNAYQGDNGDTGEEYGRLLAAVVVALIGAIVWLWADRRRPRATWAGDALRVLLRYSIALGLASYAIAKILPLQFPPLNAFSLEQRLGQLPPMALLWSFMEYSRPYNFFGGAMELAVVLLLCFRRTALLGALLCLVVMTNVAFFNYAYGVPVKLYATLIVASAAVLVLYDLRRLFDFFIKDESPPSVRVRSHWPARLPNWARWTVKTVLVGSVLVSSLVATIPPVRAQAAASSSLDGAWVVTEFAAGGRPVGANDGTPRWRRLTLARGLVAIELASDSVMFCRRSTPERVDRLAFACRNDRKGELQLTRSGNLVQLDGAFDGSPVKLTARHLERSDYPLLSWRFRWIDDR
jgi:hypothetical protein